MNERKVLEPPDELIPLARASELSGVSVGTLRLQARSRKLAARQVAYTWFTTRRWLHQYLMEASNADRGARLALPSDYVAPPPLQQEPTILRVSRTEKPTEPTVSRVERRTSVAAYVNDPNPLILIHVDGYMSDGSRMPVRLFIHKPGDVVIADEELIGLTAGQAHALAESRGTVLD